MRLVTGSDLARIVGSVKRGMRVIPRNDLKIGVEAGHFLAAGPNGYSAISFDRANPIRFDVLTTSGRVYRRDVDTCPVRQYAVGSVVRTVPGNDAVMHYLFRDIRSGKFRWILGNTKSQSMLALLRSSFSFQSSQNMPPQLRTSFLIAAFAAAGNASKTSGDAFHIYNAPAFEDSSLFVFDRL